MSHLLEVRDVHGGYHKTEIVHGVSFTVEHGEFVCIIGANGCGKTTTLKTVLGLMKPTADEIIRTDEKCSHISAVKNGRVYTMPNAPFAWCDRPPGVNRFLGVQWIANMLYPDRYEVDMVEESNTSIRFCTGSTSPMTMRESFSAIRILPTESSNDAHLDHESQTTCQQRAALFARLLARVLPDVLRAGSRVPRPANLVCMKNARSARAERFLIHEN